MGDFEVCNKKKRWLSPSKEKWNNLNIDINLLKWMVYLQTTYELRFWGSVILIFWIMYFFTRKFKYRCIRVYVWFKDDTHVIWMWIWLILKYNSLFDRILSLWLVRVAHLPTNFILWLGRLIFSVSINSHPNSIYLSFVRFYYNVQYVSCNLISTSKSIHLAQI